MATRTRTAPATTTRGKIILGEFDVRAYHQEILSRKSTAGRAKSPHRNSMDQAIHLMQNNPSLSFFSFECTDIKLGNASLIMYNAIKAACNVVKIADSPFGVHSDKNRNVLSISRRTLPRVQATPATIANIDRKMVAFDNDKMHYVGCY